MNSRNPIRRFGYRSWLKRIIEKRSGSIAGIFFLVMMGFAGLFQVAPNWFIAVCSFVVVAYELQKRLDQGVPLLPLTGVIAVLQFLVGPALNYATSYQFGRYAMRTSEAAYFQFAAPATCFYVALILAAGGSIRQRNLLEGLNTRHFFQIGLLLNFVALFATYAAGPGGDGLAFLFHLLSQLRYVGALYFIFSKHKLRYPLAVLSCFHLVSTSLSSGMFHDLILWLAILFCYWFAQKKWTTVVKLTSLTTAVIALFSIQVIKQEYRSQLRRGMHPNPISLAIDYVTPGGRAWENDVLSLAITRLNQGWIISAVMNHVPAKESFADGETIKVAALSSIAPRVLWANKVRAGGRENFRRFTGLQIAESTSMGISPLGEAYANFDKVGGILFMVAFGASFVVFYHLALLYAARHPTFIFWIPLIFYQAIKAETEVSVVLNQLTKGSLVAFACFFAIQQIFPDRFRKTQAIPESKPKPPSVAVPELTHAR